MVYNILCGDLLIGTTNFEGADPAMGFVFGAFIPNANYQKSKSAEDITIFVESTAEQIRCECVAIEDLSDEFSGQAIQVTALLISCDEFDKYFKHHSDAYDKQFKS